jgi:hypothetical protein
MTSRFASGLVHPTGSEQTAQLASFPNAKVAFVVVAVALTELRVAGVVHTIAYLARAPAAGRPLWRHLDHAGGRRRTSALPRNHARPRRPRRDRIPQQESSRASRPGERFATQALVRARPVRTIAMCGKESPTPRPADSRIAARPGVSRHSRFRGRRRQRRLSAQTAPRGRGRRRRLAYSSNAQPGE